MSRAGNASRSGRGVPEKPRPGAVGGELSLCMRCVQSQRSLVPVWSRGVLRVWSCKALLICPKAANCLLNDHVCLL